MFEKIEQTASFINSKTSCRPEIGIIFGSGLGGVAKEMEITHSIPYEDIIHFPVSTVHGHGGNLLFGHFCGKNIVAMQGRFHYYEGYSMEEVTFPVRVMKALGIELLIVSNASGGVNPDFQVGDMMIIEDHINLLPNPLIGKNDERLGVRFPNMFHAYDPSLIALAETIAANHDIPIQKGVYVGLTGPTFETMAEYRFIHRIGGDCVGMSTVPEVIVARHSHLPVFAFSIISDLGVEGVLEPPSHEEVLSAVANAEPKVIQFITHFIASVNTKTLCK